jgi:hypothetical protein
VRLNTTGRHTRLGGLFTKAAIAEILQNRTYIGMAVWAPGTPDEEILNGTHEAIITVERFEAVEAKRRRRTS